jgi:cystathionine beta-lyase/cystathionine gamma-synthase
MDCFLTLRGIKTLHIRMQRHCENGATVAHWLKNHPKVGEVYWPGFETHPNHAVAKKQMKDFGGMISFTLKDDAIDKALTFLKSTELFALAESLGGVESLVGPLAGIGQSPSFAELGQIRVPASRRECESDDSNSIRA